MPPTVRPRRLFTLATGNWFSRGYLAVVAVAIGFFLWAVYLSPDPGFAGIWPLMATAPLSVLVVAVSGPLEGLPSPLLFTAGTALAGLCNAALLGLLVRSLRR
ncbi:SCO4225 family membrane protein [Streptomyces sp. NPDC058459]|uniref:SCO4225 family membrane protein n=1 Tax=Streptomyces sp. NPDC058459 TaxID=3346508 RepID=UPI003664896B